LSFKVSDTQCGALEYLTLWIDEQKVYSFPNTCIEGVKLPYNGVRYEESFSWVWDGKINNKFVKEGTYTIVIKTKDLNTPETTAKAYFVVDNTSPRLEFIQRPSTYTNQTTVKFKWKGNDNITPSDELVWQYKIDDQPWTEFQRVYEVTYTNLAKGYHKFQLKVKDKAGNIGSKVVEFWIDLTPPEINLEKPDKYIGTTTVQFVWSGTDNYTFI
jgi:hypothetical protein